MLTVGLVETLTVGRVVEELLVETDVVCAIMEELLVETDVVCAIVEELLVVTETVIDVVAVLLARVLPERVLVERLVLGIVDRLVAVLAGGCACWWLCLLVALLAAEVGGCAVRQSMRLSRLAVSTTSCFWLD